MSRTGRQKQTDLQEVPDEEIQRRAHDRTLPVWVRLKYQKEEKCRGLRNKQRRC